jgi:hypothetical protein
MDKNEISPFVFLPSICFARFFGVFGRFVTAALNGTYLLALRLLFLVPRPYALYYVVQARARHKSQAHKS